MPELQGTPNQLAWATEIRNEVIKKIQQSIKTDTPGRAEVLSIGLPRLLAKMNRASWWIDRRLHKCSHWESEVERLVPEAQTIYDKHNEVWIF